MDSGSPYVTSDTRVTLFKGCVCGTFNGDELRPCEAPGKTFRRSHVAFPSLPTSLLSFSKEEIKETRQEVALLL